MKTFMKLVLGILTILPLLSFCAAFLLISVSRPSSQTGFPFLFVLGPLAVFLPYALGAIYLITVLMNQKFDNEKKALWGAVLFTGWSIAQIIYWYFYIWRRPSSILTKIQNM